MGERPDLDAIGRAAVNWEHQEIGAFEAFADQTVKLVMYCRELEAENKRLNSAMDEWIQKWTFEGGIYDDAPQLPKP